MVLLGINAIPISEREIASRSVSNEEIKELLREITDTSMSDESLGCGDYIECDLHDHGLADSLMHDLIRVYSEASQKKDKKIINHYQYVGGKRIHHHTTEIQPTWTSFHSETQQDDDDMRSILSMSTLTEHSIDSILREYKRQDEWEASMDNSKDNDLRSGESIRSYFEIETHHNHHHHQVMDIKEKGLHYNHHYHHRSHQVLTWRFSFSHLLAAYWSSPVCPS